MPVTKNKKPRPFFSIVIPTRDRPEYVASCLKYLSMQSFHDYEVIVSDNFVTRTCRDEFEEYSEDQRFIYLHPSQPLAMCDHWDFAISHAKGEYVAVISEKYIFRSDALKIVYEQLIKAPVELVTWWHETYHVTEQVDDKIKGTFIPLNKPEAANEFSPLEELKRCLSFVQRPYSRELGIKECLGKIYSGCFKRSLLKKIIKQYGRIFPPTSPDITSKIAGLSLSSGCIDIGQPLMLVCSNPSISNGYQCIESTSNIKKYFAELDDAETFINNLPLKEIWVGTSNYIAHDYLAIQKLSDWPDFKDIKLNIYNLLAWEKLDLDAITFWESDGERDKLFELWANYFAQCSQAQQKEITDMISKNRSNLPSPNEVSSALENNIGTLTHFVSAKERARINWIDNKVFRVADEYLYYDSLDQVMAYFTEYYQESAKLLRLI